MLRRMVFFLIVIIAASISACQEPQDTIPELRIGHAPHDHHSALYIACMNPDYFKKNGDVNLKQIVFKEKYELRKNDLLLARITILQGTGGKKGVKKIIEGELDMTLGSVPSMLYFIDKEQPISIILPLMADGAGFVMSNKYNTISNWDDFVALVKNSDKALRIGFKTAQSVQSLILEQALKESGITYSYDIEESNSQVILVNVSAARNLIPALAKGLIDGFVINQPYVAMAETEHVGKVIAYLNELPPKGRWDGVPCCALAATKTYLEKYPEVSQSFAGLLLSANKRIIENPELSIRQIAEWLDISPEIEKRSVPTISFLSEYNDNWNRGVDFWIETMIHNGIYTNRIKKAQETGSVNDVIYDMSFYNRVTAEHKDLHRTGK